ncbi:sigma-70 family RNA polymerase sigma factor [Rhizobium sp. BR 317]|uniref:sigma-70 family RNA polymerase sigma factor n=1 Tax=Rhizobium sp. BR 317 TaxID=3040015 RepID=UPI0039BF9496
MDVMLTALFWSFWKLYCSDVISVLAECPSSKNPWNKDTSQALLFYPIRRKKMPEATSASLHADVVLLLPALRNFARRFVSSPTDVDDLAQETVWKILRHSEKFTPGTSLKSWAFTIMRNTYMTEYKRRKRLEIRANDDVVFEVPMECRQQKCIYAIEVGKALDRLPKYQRDALLMIVEGVSYEAAAERCGCEIGTIKSRVSRARNALIAMLGEESVRAAASIH